VSWRPQWEKFCHEYLVDFNATAAAIRSGYSEKSAGDLGPRLSKRPEIQARLAELMDERLNARKVTAERVITELAAVGFTNLNDVMFWDTDGNGHIVASADLSAESAPAIKSMKVTQTYTPRKDLDPIITTRTEIVMHDKVRALERLGEYRRAFGREDRGWRGPPEGVEDGRTYRFEGVALLAKDPLPPDNVDAQPAPLPEVKKPK